jgi:tetratricopeptide (TPR) repeat protein
MGFFMKKFTFLSILLTLTFLACQNADQSKQEKDNSSVKDQAVQSESFKDPNDSALQIVNQKIREDLENPDLYVDRSEIYLNQGDIDAGIKDLDRAFRLDSTNLKTLMAQARFFTRRGRVEAAKRVLERAKGFHPEESDIYVMLGELYLIAKDYDNALRHADLAVKYDIYNDKAYFVKAYTFLELGDTAKAISSFQTSVEQNPDNYNGYLQLGLLYTELNDPLAIEYFENALAVKPNDKDALYAKGMYEQEHEMYNEAMQSYTQAIKAHPDFREAYYNMGFLHMYYLKLYREGLNYFDQAIKVDPEYYQAYYNRGYSFELLGDIGNAAKDYRKALSIQPDYTMAAKGLERVTSGNPPQQ